MNNNINEKDIEEIIIVKDYNYEYTITGQAFKNNGSISNNCVYYIHR